MTSSRSDAFRAMLAKDPADPRAHFGLANEALKAGHYADAVEHLQTYLRVYDDEGNGYGRLAEALAALGRGDEAREALRRGIDAAERFGHPSMAGELSARLDELEDA